MAPTTVIVNSQRDVITVPGNLTSTVVVNAGAQGPPGPGNLFISDTAPSAAPVKYMWVQTGLGDTGDDWTIWIEDGS